MALAPKWEEQSGLRVGSSLLAHGWGLAVVHAGKRVPLALSLELGAQRSRGWYRVRGFELANGLRTEGTDE